MAAIFRFVDSARSNAGHAQKNISGDRQTGNYPVTVLFLPTCIAISPKFLALFTDNDIEMIIAPKSELSRIENCRHTVNNRQLH